MADNREKGVAHESDNDDHNSFGVAPLQMKALVSHFERMLDKKLEGLHERLDRVESRTSSQRTTQANQRQAHAARPQHCEYAEDMESHDEDYEGEETQPRRRPLNIQRRPLRRPRDEEEGLGGVKVKIPSFQGKSDPETYLEWEMRVEQIFSCHNYSEGKKVKIAALEFTDYALIWWDQMQKERIRYGEHLISTWEEMKAIMRRRFIPSYFRRELHNKLQRLTQGSKSVDEYYKEMQIAMIRANVEEDLEATIARFLDVFNRDITDVVKIYHYVEIHDLVY